MSTPPPSAGRPGPPPPPPIRPNAAGRAEAIFDSALDLPEEELEGFLVAECGGDDGLLKRVRALLAAQTAAADFLEVAPTSPEIEEQLARLKPEEAGDRIGPYKLLQEIGVGGFGTVWMADQEKPVKRRVALKIIKLGMDTKEVIARFEQERQALAIMDHGNIAKVFDAGATQWGRPFFVMELVKGIPITEFCDSRGLGTRERLALFGDVCSAINYAHQKGVIHRDIKPSNVLVTLHGDKPVVKVIDFGIAKATQDPLTDKTLFTRFEQFIGTPVYMSPEQAALSGLDIDTRSDIYALGILLYELLTGKPPFDAQTLASAGYDEMRRIIREVEPPRPSMRLSTVAGEERTTLAKARHTEPEKLSRLVEPDLDWIVMKAIDKDRTRRYETANGLALDIERFLADEPVTARPPSAAYKFRKFTRRNKLAFAAAAAVALALIVGIVGTTLGLLRAEKERRAAEEAQRLAEHRFRSALRFVDDVFEKVAPEFSDLVGAPKAREALARTSLSFVESLGNPDESDEAFQTDLAKLYSRLADSLGDAYAPNSMADYEAALRFATQALTLRNNLLRKNPSDPERLRQVAVLEMQVGDIFSQLGRDDEAMPRYQRSLAGFEAVAKALPDDARATDNVRIAHWYVGAGLRRQGRALEALEKHLLPYSVDWLERPLARPADRTEAHRCYVAHELVGEALLELGRAAEALPHFEKSFAWVKIKVEMAPDNPRGARDWSELLRFIGKTEIALGQVEGGAQKLDEAVRRSENLVARDPTNGLAQLEFLDALAFQSEGFAAQAKLAGISPAKQTEFWRHAVQVLKKCRDRSNAPELQRIKLVLKLRAERIAKSMAEAERALERLAARDGR